jgi:hypothetical protein
VNYFQNDDTEFKKEWALQVKNVWPMLQLSITSVNRVKATTPIDEKTVAVSLKTFTATPDTD